MSIEGNRGHRGSTPAEINHASIVAYFGKGNNWSIMEQINELMKRHQNHEKIRERDKQKLYVLGYNFKSLLNNVQMAKEQKLARQSLSDFAYKHLYLPASNAQRYLQKKGCKRWRYCSLACN